jgi:hypothetical protein
MDFSPKQIVIKDITVTTGGNLTIESGTFTIGAGVPADDHVIYRFIGSSTLGSDLDIVLNGTPQKNTQIITLWEASVILSGNDVTLFGVVVPSQLATINWYAISTYDGSAWKSVILPSWENASIVTATQLASDAVSTSKIVDEAVTVDKMADLTSAYLLIGNASNRPVGVAVSGDITITNAGVTAIGALKVLNAMINDLDAAKLTGTVAAARIAAASLASTKLSDIGRLNSQYSDTATTAITTAETLYTYTVPGGTIAANGEGISVKAYGTFAANANTKSITAKFGTNTYASNAVTTAPNGTDFKMEFQVLRTGVAGAVGFGEAVVETVNQGVTVSKGGITWASDTDVTIVGTNGTAAANDIVLSMVIVEQIR